MLWRRRSACRRRLPLRRQIAKRKWQWRRLLRYQWQLRLPPFVRGVVLYQWQLRLHPFVLGEDQVCVREVVEVFVLVELDSDRVVDFGLVGRSSSRRRPHLHSYRKRMEIGRKDVEFIVKRNC